MLRFWFGCLAGAALLVAIQWDMGYRPQQWRARAIENGCAAYAPDGTFSWRAATPSSAAQED